jgi:hypothetical protein
MYLIAFPGKIGEVLKDHACGDTLTRISIYLYLGYRTLLTQSLETARIHWNEDLHFAQTMCRTRTVIEASEFKLAFSFTMLALKANHIRNG